MKDFVRNLKATVAFMVLGLSFITGLFALAAIPTVMFEPMTFAIKWESITLAVDLIGVLSVSIVAGAGAATILGHLENTRINDPFRDQEDLEE